LRSTCHHSTSSPFSKFAIWPFLKQFSRSKMIWTFGLFLLFLILKAYFGSMSTNQLTKLQNLFHIFWPLFGLFPHLRFGLFKTAFGHFLGGTCQPCLSIHRHLEQGLRKLLKIFVTLSLEMSCLLRVKAIS
jgi:hypothetical protein